MIFPARRVYRTDASAPIRFEGSSCKTTRSAGRPAAIRPDCFEPPKRAAGAVVRDARIWGEGHPGPGHQGVFLAGIILDCAEVVSEKNRPSSGDPSPQLGDPGGSDAFLAGYAVVPHVVLPHGQGRGESDGLFLDPVLDPSKDRFVPWAGAGSGVSDDIHLSSNRGEHFGGGVGVNKDGFAEEMGFLNRDRDDAVPQRGAGGGGREQLDSVHAFLQKLPAVRGGFGGIGHLDARVVQDAHEAENGVGRNSRVRGKQAPPGGANFGARHFAGFDAVANAAGVVPAGPEVEHAGEPVSGEHVLKLAGEVAGGYGRGIRPLSFKEVHVAVPESGGYCEAGTIQRLGTRRDAQRLSAAHGGDLWAPDEDHAVPDGRFERTDVDGPSDESQLHVRGGLGLTESGDAKQDR